MANDSHGQMKTIAFGILLGLPLFTWFMHVWHGAVSWIAYSLRTGQSLLDAFSLNAVLLMDSKYYMRELGHRDGVPEIALFALGFFAIFVSTVMLVDKLGKALGIGGGKTEG